jgi:2-keto-4-pentenoate hydratase
MQDAYQELITSSRGPIVGYKAALTTPVIQRMVGFNEPCAGAVFANGVHQSAALIRGTAYVHLGAQCEVAVLLNRDMPAFALVDDRGADYSDLFFLGVVADNTWNAGVVLEAHVAAWRNIDLAAARGAMIINGHRAGEGKGGDVMGHPLEALAWLANTLAAREEVCRRE